MSDWFEDEEVKPVEEKKPEVKRLIAYSIGSFEEEEWEKFRKKYGGQVNKTQKVWESKQCKV